MSYILDALKKAERERGVAKVPTLETVHQTPEKSRKGPWIVSATVLILLSAGAAWYLSRINRDGVSGAPAVEHAREPARSDGVGRLPAGSRPVREETQSRVPNAVSPQTVETNPDAGTVRSADSDLAPGGVSPKPPRIAAGKAQSAGPAEQPGSNPSGKLAPVTLPENAQTASTPAAGGAEAVSGDAALQEAIQNMRVSIHQYSDTPAKRLIFVDGKKYAEGDYINGVYRIETITPEGAVLSFEGARATLKAAM
jgi:general secretion pathway protein B